MHAMLLSKVAGQLVTKVKIKAPLPFTGIDLGLTSTSLFPCSSKPTNSARSVKAKFSVLLKANFTYLLLLFLTMPNLIILVPSSLTSSLLHLTSGILAVWLNITLRVSFAPSNDISSHALIAQSTKKGVLTPTTKLQTPFCMALNLNSSKYSKEVSLRMPKMNQDRSVSVWSSKIICMEMTLAVYKLLRMIIPNFRYCTLPHTESPKSMPEIDVARYYQIPGISIAFLLALPFSSERLQATLVSSCSGSFIRYYEEIIKYIDSRQEDKGDLQIFQYMSKYQNRADPLDLLRAAYSDPSGKQRVKLKDKQLIFEKDVRVPIHLLTAWVSPVSKKQYTIGSLWLYLEYFNGSVSDYMTRISELGVDNVTISDRDQIKNYFTGKSNDSQCINQEIKLQLATKNISKVRDQPTTGFEDINDPNKKQKVDVLSPQLQVIDFIYKFQRPTSSKTRSLRCPNKSFESLLKVLQSNGADETTKSQEKKMRINTILQRKKCPIIIVPEHHQAGNLSLGNIQKFLVTGEYVENPPALHQHQRKIEMQCTLKGKKLLFQVTNNPALLTPTDWNNVVAIFVQGRKNEFQNWFYRDPVDIFKRTRGFLLKFPTKEQIQGQDWNIKVFTLDRNVRYRDSGVQKAIWNEIESFLYEKV